MGEVIWSQNIYRSGHINGEETWQADTVFVVDTLRIGATGTLTILPGTTVLFDNAHPMYCDGKLFALGSADAPIVFTNSDTLGLHNLDSTNGGWKGIWFFNSDSATQIDSARFYHCVFRYAKAHPFRTGGALHFESWQNVDVRHCLFTNNITQSGGASLSMLRHGWVNIDSCKFIANKTKGGGGNISIYAYKSSVTNSIFFYNSCYSGTLWAYGGTGSAAIISRGLPINSLQNQLEDTSSTIISGNWIAFNSSGSTNFVVDGKYTKIYNNIFYMNVNGALGINNASKAGNWSSVAYNLFINNTEFGPEFYTDSVLFVSNILWNNGMDVVGGQELQRLARPSGGYFFPKIFSNNIIKGGYPEGENNIDQIPDFINPPYYLAPGQYPLLFIDEPDSTDFHLIDFRPLAYSPTVDAGYPYTENYMHVSSDFYGMPRNMGLSPDIGPNELLDYNSMEENNPGHYELLLYPNPCSEKQIRIKTDKNITAAFLVDVTGKIYKLTVLGNELMLPVSIPSGTYLVSIQLDKMCTKKRVLILTH